MKTYKYEVYCLNCGVTELVDCNFGEQRPNKRTCTNCGCLADTKPANFNQNIKFPKINPGDGRLFC